MNGEISSKKGRLAAPSGSRRIRTVRRVQRLIASSAFVVAVLFTLPATGFAHHSPSMYSGDPISLTGVVREFQWSNPHSYIQLIVETEDGEQEEWSVEMGANAYLYNLGWRPSTLKPDDRIVVSIIPLRNGAKGGLLMDITAPDGTPIGGRA